MRNLVGAGELDALVPERVWAECERALAEPTPMAFFVTLDMCCATQKLFPELSRAALLHGDLDGFLEACFADTPTNAHLRFALTCLKLSESDINDLCARLKVPNEFRTLAIRAVKFVNTLRNDLTPESVVATLEASNGFQDVGNVAEVVFVATHSAYNTTEFRQRLKLVANVAPVVCGVRFADLTTEQQATLKGPAVGAALRELRLRVVIPAL
jgi:tRNA nucleotidyltransferase (CCA-adding enzyme)